MIKISKRSLPLAFLLGCYITTLNASERPPFQSESFKPAKAPAMRGPLAKNNELQTAEVLAKGLVSGPEEFAVDAQGRIYTGSDKGLVQRINSDGSVETFAITGGHPLGMDFTADGDLIVCEPFSGLLSINPEGVVSVLAQEADGVPFKLVDDVIVASDGLIYFTDASSRYTLEYFRYDFLESSANGRLLVYDPNLEETKVLINDLYFANGVTLSADESYLLVNETSRYQIRRYWLKGPRQGENEIFAKNLPGFPDGISLASDGNYLVAFFAPRSKEIDTILPLKFLKNILAKLPESFLPAPDRYGLIVKYDSNGEPIESFQDPEGKVAANLTSVLELDGFLYMGTLNGDAIFRYRLD